VLYGFIRVAAATHSVKVADVDNNVHEICNIIKGTGKKKVSLLVFPELAVSAYTCNDLFWQSTLLEKSKTAVDKIVEFSKNYEMIIAVGFPFEYKNKLYNSVAVILKGKILGIVPKVNIPNYNEFYELRHFTKGHLEPFLIDWDEKNKDIPFGSRILFKCENINNLAIGVEICEDLWVPNSPSISHCLAGASIIINSSASDEVIGKNIYRNQLVIGKSASLICGYVYANTGIGESTQDLVFSGHNIIAENGNLLAESERFSNSIIYGDIDLEKLNNERRKMTSYNSETHDSYYVSKFKINIEDFDIERNIDPHPFVPAEDSLKNKRCEEILNIQSHGLRKRLEHTRCKYAIIGISGGLDSTLALLVINKAFDILKISKKNIIAVTMPCFGTTDRTYQNACQLIANIGATFLEIDIKKAILQHFSDIGQDINNYDVTYENSQARERTQVLMDLANKYNGLVIGTGDLSELALGWATYNGDHMSMYGVNCSVPKTLVRHLVKFYADSCGNKKLKKILLDVLDTPVSPELLPPINEEISQKTEDLIGPYELHDFFLYYMLRFGYSPKKIFYLAECAFKKEYKRDVILKWIKIFYRRFFNQQFKRSCIPDGPKVGSVALSPRGDLRMATDSVSKIWSDELDEL
jgi:NAD+ synthase (glutamine-hydrolysing)